VNYDGHFDYPFGDFLIVSASCLGVVVTLMVLTAVLTKVTGRVSVVDTIWGLGFIAVTITAAVLGRAIGPDTIYIGVSGTGPIDNPFDEQTHRIWLLIVLVTIWGARLAWHIGRRSHGGGEDPRYTELMERGPGGLIRKVLLPQGLAIWFVSLPIQVSVLSMTHVGPVLWIGVALFVIGLAFESVGDAQLAAYKRDADRGPVMDRGLWRYTRHPNYFGDACVWWGIYLVCASSWPGVFTILSPVAMTYFLVFATGARLLERTMMQRPGYPEYAAKTSMFFPLPPKRGLPEPDESAS
jgi:steroid 5-alpha reductase family enzyme